MKQKIIITIQTKRRRIIAEIENYLKKKKFL